MNIKRFFTILLIFFILLCCIGSVNASSNHTMESCDDSSDNMINAVVEENMIDSGESEDTLNENPTYDFNDLQKIIDNASEGSVIKIDGSYKGSTNYISINKPLTIEGNNTLFDGCGLDEIYFISSANVCLKNMRFVNVNGLYAVDTFVDLNANRNISIINCSFKGAQVGGVDMIDYCTFEDTSISTVCPSYLNNTRMTNSTISSNNKLVIENSLFNNCGNEYGYVISSYNELTIINSIFRDNKFSDMDGALVNHLNKDCNIIGCLFENNKGIPVVSAKKCRINVIDSRFLNNDKGLWLKKSTSAINDCLFSGMKSSSINFNRAVKSSVVGSIFTNNHGDNSGSGISDSKGANLIIDKCSFSNNKANIHASCISLGQTESAIISNCLFSDNIKSSCVCNFYKCKKVTVDTCSFLNNPNTDEAVFVYYVESINVINSYFKDNAGSAIDVLQDPSAKKSHKVLIKGSTFINNGYQFKYDNIGGAISLKNAKGTIQNCIFKNNANLNGGAMVIDGSAVTIAGCTFTKNSAKRNGGAIFFWNCDDKCSVKNSKFTSNTAKKGKGGAIYIDGAYLKTSKVSFKKNKAKKGKNIYNYHIPVTKIKAPKITAKFKKSKYFKITVYCHKTPIKNIKVTVKVYTNKKFKKYKLKTNKKGVIKINTKKLSRGKHKVKIKIYEELDVYSKNSLIRIK